MLLLVSEMNLNEFNVSTICRLCLRSSEDLTNIFADARSNQPQNADLAARILACVSLKILPTDRGPHSICDKCLESVNNWHEFYEVCQVSNALLVKYLNEPSEAIIKNSNPTLAKSSLLNENCALPEISILSHDSLLDRSFGLESNASPLRDFCISPSPYDNKLDEITTGVTLKGFVSGNTNSSVSAAVEASASVVAVANVNSTKTSPASQTKGYECEFCKCIFTRFTSLLNHDSKEHATMEKESCPICGRLFVSINRLIIHKNLVHREKCHRCESCNKFFSSRKSLSVHQRLHSGKYKCKSCGFVTTSKLYLTQHVKKHDGKGDAFVCSTCDKHFSHRSSLLRHENLHLAGKGKLYRCTICQFAVRSRCELVQHLSTHQTVPKLYRCDVCRRSFKSRRVLGMHRRRHEPAPLNCDICDKKLFSQYELRIHRETHSDCKMFVCFHCQKRFSFKNTLVRHLKKHYSRTRSDIKV